MGTAMRNYLVWVNQGGKTPPNWVAPLHRLGLRLNRKVDGNANPVRPTVGRSGPQRTY